MTAARKQPPWLTEAIAPNGRPVRENFGAWFRASKATDGADHPLVAYHGAKERFTIFDKEKISSGLGFHFGDRQHARLFAKNADCIVAVYLRIEHPYYGDILETDETFNDPAKRRKWIAARKREGHDGAILEGGDGNEYVVFEPEQIKSATNNSGDYDPTNPCIEDSAPAPAPRAKRGPQP